jgi:adhesin/invasin
MRFSPQLSLLISCGLQAAVAVAGWDTDPAGAASAATGVPQSARPSSASAQAESPPNPAPTLGIRLAQGLVNGGSSDKAALAEVARVAVDAAQTEGKRRLPTFELGFAFAEHSKPVIGILGVVPLYESEDLSNTVFTQLSGYHTDGRTTANLGLGNRHLVANERVLLGVNAFYDHEFPYAHARSSVGAEVRTTVAELNANFYQGRSGWKSGRYEQDERAMGGHDVEIGVALPHIPQVKVYARQFQWNGHEGRADLKGNAVSVKGTPFHGISFELGRTRYDGGAQPNSNFLSWHVDIVKLMDSSHRASKPFFTPHAYALDSMRERRFDKVRRENIIQKQTGRGFVITASGR